MKIVRPILVPKYGYVEAEDMRGNHYYKPTPEKEEELERENQIKMLEAKLKATIESNLILEDCLVEMAMLVYA